MKFQLSTKPLADALALGVVNANVSKFYSKSCLAQVTAERKSLKINLEANLIVSEIRLKGMGDEDTPVTVFVDSLLLKQLVHTFEANVTTLEFTESGLILHNGKSKFTLPKMADGDELSLKTPEIADYTAESIEIDKSNWKFIKDYQMYAIAMAFIHPVYTKVWIGDNGDVLVGDFDNSLFTHSTANKLGTTCLLSDTIINLFNSLPDGAKLKKIGNKYQIDVVTDGFEMLAEFTPQYEDDENVGEYNADIILGMMERPTDNYVTVSTAALHKFMNQADLLASGSEATIILGIENRQMYLKDSNVDCKIDVEGSSDLAFKVEFKTSLLKSVISNYDAEKLKVGPMYQEDEIVGIIVWSDELTTVLAGVDE